MSGTPKIQILGKGFGGGANGFSPTVEITDIDGGHRITITDVNGPKSFDVMDGVGTTVDLDEEITEQESLITQIKVALQGKMSAVGISSIEKTSTEGLIDTYTITYTDGSTSTFTVTNGADGTNGKDGAAGKDGANGADGKDGANGADGKDGNTPYIQDGYWHIDGTSTGVKAEGVDGKDGEDGAAGKDGADGKDGTDGSTPYIQEGYWYINGASTGVKADSAPRYSEGLSFYQNSGDEMCCVGIGDCTDTDIIIPPTYMDYPVSLIYSQAFQGTNITSVVIPNTVYSIGSGAFAYCAELKAVVIPQSVTDIEESAFHSSASATIYCEAESKPSGWHANWNSSNLPVVWGYTGDFPSVNKKIDELNEQVKDISGKTADKLSAIEIGGIPNTYASYEGDGYGIGYSTTFETNLGAGEYIYNRIPLVAGENVTFEDSEVGGNKVVKINASGGGSSSLPIVTTTGTGSAYVATISGITELTKGLEITIIPHTASTTTAPTLNVNGLGAKAIRRQLSSQSSAGNYNGYLTYWISANYPIRLMYSGTYWVAVDLPKTNAQDLNGRVPVSNGGVPSATTSNSGQALIVGSTGTPSWQPIKTVDTINYIDLQSSVEDLEYNEQKGVYWGAEAEVECGDDYYYPKFHNKVPIVAGDNVTFSNEGEVIKINATGGGSSGMPIIRFTGATDVNGTMILADGNTIALTVEIIGGGALQVGDKLQLCVRRTSWYRREDGSRYKKQKLRSKLSYEITADDLEKRFLSVQLYEGLGSWLYRNDRYSYGNSLSPMYLRIKRATKYNSGGVECDATFSNVVTVWKTYNNNSRISIK